jgi:hypothetical protein
MFQYFSHINGMSRLLGTTYFCWGDTNLAIFSGFLSQQIQKTELRIILLLFITVGAPDEISQLIMVLKLNSVFLIKAESE